SESETDGDGNGHGIDLRFRLHHIFSASSASSAVNSSSSSSSSSLRPLRCAPSSPSARAELLAKDLSRRAFWELRKNLDDSRVLRCGELALAMLLDLFGRRLRAKRHVRLHLFAVARILHADDSGLAHGRVGVEDLLDLSRVDVETAADDQDRKSTRLNSSHVKSSYAVFCLKKKIE